MANVTVIGAQWGDEGKGKIIDWLVQPRRDGGALPGRQQCRPHHRGGRQDLQACRCCRPAWCRASAPSSAMAWWSTPGRCWTKSPGSARPASRSRPTFWCWRKTPCWCCRCTASWTRCARTPPARRSAPPSAASARPMKTRSGRRALRAIDLKDPDSAARQDRAAAGPSQCAAPGLRPCRSRCAARCWRR